MAMKSTALEVNWSFARSQGSLVNGGASAVVPAVVLALIDAGFGNRRHNQGYGRANRFASFYGVPLGIRACCTHVAGFLRGRPAETNGGSCQHE